MNEEPDAGDDVALDEPGPVSAHDSRQVLALAGGGYRGLYTATVLRSLEARAGRPLRDVFDVVAGTSIGGIVAGAVALGIPAADVRQGIADNGEKIFGKRFRLGPFGARFTNPLRIVYRAKHASGPLRQAIHAIFGAEAETPLDTIDTPLLITAIDATSGKPRLFRSRGLAGKSGAAGVSMIDALMATAAAPTFFAPHTIDRHVHVDGGLIANAPDLVALTDTMQILGAPLDRIRMLSVGTAGSVHQIGKRGGKPGILQWLVGRGLVQLILSSQEGLAVDQCRVLLDKRYLRIDTQPDAKDSRHLGLDRAGDRATQLLTRLANEELARVDAAHDQLLRRLLRHRSRGPRPQPIETGVIPA